MSTESYIGQQFKVNRKCFTVERIIAEGGFALVFQVVESGNGKQFAMKRIMVNNEADLKLAKQEIAVMRALANHRNSVTLQDWSISSKGNDIHEILIVMQLYDGGTVLEMMNARLDRGFTEHEVLRIFTDVLLAVTRLHHRTKPIIHRDLKIENIICSQQGVFVLCDYGSCHVCEMEPEKMGYQQCEDEVKRFTTLAYRSPEMVDLYSGQKITTKSDIWSLGCLLYKLCFFTTPFGEQPLAILSGSFFVPDNSRYSDQMHRLIKYLLEVDPQKRPDIFQVAHVVFAMKGERNPVPNIFHSPIPSQLPLPPTETESKQTAAPTKKKLLAPAVVETSIVGRDRPRTGLSPVLPRRGRSPRRPSPNGQSALLTEEEASKQPRGAVRGHQLVGRTQSEFVQGATANRTQPDVFGATPFATSNLPANQLKQRSHDNDFDPRAPPSPPPENKGNPPLEEIHQNFPPPPPGFADQEFDDFFIASEEPDVSMATTTEHRTRKHPPQPVEGFADSFSSGHPASALPTEVTSDVIPAVDQGIPPACSPDPFGAPRFVHRTPASSCPRPPSQSENENEDTAAPKTSQPNSRHQRTDSFGLTPFVEQGSQVKGQPPKVSSEVKGQPLPSANRPEPVYATVTKKTAKQEDPFGLSPFMAEGRQHSSPNPAYTASQRPPQSAPHQSPTATTRVPPHSNLDRSLDLFEPEPVRPGATKQTPRGGQQGVQYHSSSPWQQGADCFGAIPFVSVAAKDN